MNASSTTATDDRIVVCAVDLGPLTSRVMYHAAGFARALGARLTIVYVAEHANSIDAAARLSRAYQGAIPHDPGADQPTLAIRTGPIVERILQEANRPGVEMLVTGTRALGGVAKFILGSTSEGVLRDTRVPVLLVPPNEIDIVFLASSGSSIVCGPVLAAIDLAENNTRQLHLASAIATLAGEPLTLLTVAGNGTDDHAGARLRSRARTLEPVRTAALIVKRGNVDEEIADGVRAAHAGLVVMGLRDAARGRPGRTAAAVLRSARAFVLAVPDDGESGRQKPADGQSARLSAQGS